MRVAILRHKFVRAWPDEPGKPEGERAYRMSLGNALVRDYTTDAHFAQYDPPNGRRLKSEALEQGLAVPMTCVVFDVDCPETHGTSTPAPEAWRSELRAKMAALHDAHPGLYYYETRGGARIVYRLAEPTILRGYADARTWGQDYAIAVAYLSRRFGIEADPSCGDWTRLFRLPRATRTPGGQPEEWLAVGDANGIGALRIDADHADMERAKPAKVFREYQRGDLTPCTSDGHGLLYHLLRARGDIFRERGNGFVIRCPNEAQHTGGRTGDGSTLLYLPKAGEEVGAVHCMHAHCQAMAARDWIRCFSDGEVAEARRAAGIKRAS